MIIGVIYTLSQFNDANRTGIFTDSGILLMDAQTNLSGNICLLLVGKRSPNELTSVPIIVVDRFIGSTGHSLITPVRCYNSDQQLATIAECT